MNKYDKDNCELKKIDGHVFVVLQKDDSINLSQHRNAQNLAHIMLQLSDDSLYTQNFDQYFKTSENALNNSIPNNNVFDSILFIAFESNIVGFISFKIVYEQCEIDFICIQKKQRKHKMGTILFEHFLNYITSLKKIEHIHLEVSEKNNAALKFYEKFNFIKTGTRKNYYKDSSHAILMSKNLS